MTSRALVLLAVASLSLAVCAAPASAVFLDEERDFKLTGTFYTQARVRIVNTNPPHGQQIQPFYQGGTPLNVSAGSLSQWRNFAAPAFEGNLTRRLGLWFLDDLSFRFVGRFTYDGVYDFGPDTYREALRRFSVSAHSSPLGGTQPVPVFVGEEAVEVENSPNKAAQRARRLDDQEVSDPRGDLAEQMEAWEAYINVKRGPVFLRIGRQNLSWGETDGIRLLDEINPTNNFFGLTFDEDLDEKRIPLWMLRAIYDLPSIGPVSHLALEAFGVPGIIDTTQNPVLLQGFLHPYAPPTGCDAQLIADNTVAALQGNIPAETVIVPPGCQNALPAGSPLRGAAKTSLYERLPDKTWKHSRYGARITGVLWRNYTFSLVGYRSYTDLPNARVHYLDTVAVRNILPGFPEIQIPQLAPYIIKTANTAVTIPTTVVVETVHPQETIVGGSLSFFQPRYLPGVVRMEGGYFFGENQCTRIACEGWPGIGLVDTRIPRVDYIRWMLGYDVYDLNIPWLSRTNNIIIITQWFNTFRVTDVRQQDKDQVARAGLPPEFAEFVLNQNPDRHGLAITPASRYSAVWSVAVQNFMMHGNLNPQIIGVAFTEGDFGLLPNVVYHINDALQVKVGVAYIFGRFSQLGLFRDRSQAGVRVSYLLN